VKLQLLDRKAESCRNSAFGLNTDRHLLTTYTVKNLQSELNFPIYDGERNSFRSSKGAVVLAEHRFESPSEPWLPVFKWGCLHQSSLYINCFGTQFLCTKLAGIKLFHSFIGMPNDHPLKCSLPSWMMRHGGQTEKKSPDTIQRLAKTTIQSHWMAQ
jgi:hypothetical protein